jgi:hypothetical protein
MSTHVPCIGDKFWDGQERPQPNGYVLWINWAPIDFEDKEVVVIFHDSYHRRTYSFGEIKDYWQSKYNLYKLNESDWAEGFHYSDPVEWKRSREEG